MDTATIWFTILISLLIIVLIGVAHEKETNIPTKKIDW